MEKNNTSRLLTYYLIILTIPSAFIKQFKMASAVCTATLSRSERGRRRFPRLYKILEFWRTSPIATRVTEGEHILFLTAEKQIRYQQDGEIGGSRRSLANSFLDAKYSGRTNMGQNTSVVCASPYLFDTHKICCKYTPHPPPPSPRHPANGKKDSPPKSLNPSSLHKDRLRDKYGTTTS